MSERTRIDVAANVATALQGWLRTGDATELIAAVAPTLDIDPAKAITTLTEHAPITVGVLAKGEWAEGHDAGYEDGRDTSCCASGTSNPYDTDLGFVRMERAYRATVDCAGASSGRAVVLAGHGHGQEVLGVAARLHLYSTRDVVAREEHRVCAPGHEPGAMRDVADGHWWVEVAFDEAGATNAVTVVTAS